MTVRFHPLFVDDFLDAVEYHRAIDEELSQKLASEIGTALDQIEAQPLTCRTDGYGFRRFLISRFRYLVHFACAQDTGEIFIIALAHTSRMPGFWLNRIEPEET